MPGGGGSKIKQDKTLHTFLTVKGAWLQVTSMFTSAITILQLFNLRATTFGSMAEHF